MSILGSSFSGASPSDRRGLAVNRNIMETIDRNVLGALIQRVPSDHYTLNLRFPDLDGGRWQRGVIGDLPGPQVIDAATEGCFCLGLRDITELLRIHLGPLGYTFPETTASGERLVHGLVLASGGQSLSVSDRVGSGMVRVLEGHVRLIFTADEQPAGHAAAEQVIEIDTGHDFHWHRRRPRRFETGDALVIALTRSVESKPTSRWRLFDPVRRLHRRVFGAPELWATSMMGTTPIGGHPRPGETSDGGADYRLVRRSRPPTLHL